jgi:hypothetical protein
MLHAMAAARLITNAPAGDQSACSRAFICPEERLKNQREARQILAAHWLPVACGQDVDTQSTCNSRISRFERYRPYRSNKSRHCIAGVVGSRGIAPGGICSSRTSAILCVDRTR